MKPDDPIEPVASKFNVSPAPALTLNVANGVVADGDSRCSHEQNESVTDPIPNDAWTNGAGANQGEEVGDQCARQMGTPLGTAPDGAKYNQVIKRS